MIDGSAEEVLAPLSAPPAPAEPVRLSSVTRCGITRASSFRTRSQSNRVCARLETVSLRAADRVAKSW